MAESLNLEQAEPSEEAPAPKIKKKKKRTFGAGLLIFLGVLIFFGVVYMAGSKVDLTSLLTPHKLWTKMVWPICRTIIFISFGLLAGQLIESLGWTNRLGRLAWPLVQWARLPAAAGAAFTSAFISGVLANTMLLTAYQEKHLDRKGLIYANLLNATLPAWVLHAPTTMFVIISLTGRAGFIYMMLTLAAAVVRLAAISTISRFTMPVCELCVYEAPGSKRSWGEIWSETWSKFATRLKRVVLVVVPVYIVVVLVAESGFFDWLRQTLASGAVGLFFPIETMGVVIFAVVAEFTSGFAAAGALLESGALGVKEVVLALLIGNIVATPVRALRHQLPHYMGIYSPGLGSELLAIGQGTRILSIIFVGVAFILLY